MLKILSCVNHRFNVFKSSGLEAQFHQTKSPALLHNTTKAHHLKMLTIEMTKKQLGSPPDPDEVLEFLEEPNLSRDFKHYCVYVFSLSLTPEEYRELHMSTFQKFDRLNFENRVFLLYNFGNYGQPLGRELLVLENLNQENAKKLGSSVQSIAKILSNYLVPSALGSLRLSKVLKEEMDSHFRDKTNCPPYTKCHFFFMLDLPLDAHSMGLLTENVDESIIATQAYKDCLKAHQKRSEALSQEILSKLKADNKDAAKIKATLSKYDSRQLLSADPTPLLKELGLTATRLVTATTEEKNLAIDILFVMYESGIQVSRELCAVYALSVITQKTSSAIASDTLNFHRFEEIVTCLLRDCLEEPGDAVQSQHLLSPTGLVHQLSKEIPGQSPVILSMSSNRQTIYVSGAFSRIKPGKLDTAPALIYLLSQRLAIWQRQPENLGLRTPNMDTIVSNFLISAHRHHCAIPSLRAYINELMQLERVRDGYFLEFPVKEWCGIASKHWDSFNQPEIDFLSTTKNLIRVARTQHIVKSLVRRIDPNAHDRQKLLSTLNIDDELSQDSPAHLHSLQQKGARVLNHVYGNGSKESLAVIGGLHTAINKQITINTWAYECHGFTEALDTNLRFLSSEFDIPSTHKKASYEVEATATIAAVLNRAGIAKPSAIKEDDAKESTSYYECLLEQLTDPNYYPQLRQCKIDEIARVFQVLFILIIRTKEELRAQFSTKILGAVSQLLRPLATQNRDPKSMFDQMMKVQADSLSFVIPSQSTLQLMYDSLKTEMQDNFQEALFSIDFSAEVVDLEPLRKIAEECGLSTEDLSPIIWKKFSDQTDILKALKPFLDKTHKEKLQKRLKNKRKKANQRSRVKETKADQTKVAAVSLQKLFQRPASPELLSKAEELLQQHPSLGEQFHDSLATLKLSIANAAIKEKGLKAASDLSEAEAKLKVDRLLTATPSEEGLREVESVYLLYLELRAEFNPRFSAYELTLLNKRLEDRMLAAVNNKEEYQDKIMIADLLSTEPSEEGFQQIESTIENRPSFRQEFGTQRRAYKLSIFNARLTTRGLSLNVESEKAYHAAVFVDDTLHQPPTTTKRETIEARLAVHSSLSPVFQIRLDAYRLQIMNTELAQIGLSHVESQEDYRLKRQLYDRLQINQDSPARFATLAESLSTLQQHPKLRDEFSTLISTYQGSCEKWAADLISDTASSTWIDDLRLAAADIPYDLKRNHFLQLCCEGTADQIKSSSKALEISYLEGFNHALVHNKKHRQPLLDTLSNTCRPTGWTLSQILNEDPLDINFLTALLSHEYRLDERMYMSVIQIHRMPLEVKELAARRQLSFYENETISDPDLQALIKLRVQHGVPAAELERILSSRLRSRALILEDATNKARTRQSKACQATLTPPGPANRPNLLQSVEWALNGLEPITVRAVILTRLTQLTSQLAIRVDTPYAQAVNSLLDRVKFLETNIDSLQLGSELTRALYFSNAAITHLSTPAQQARILHSELEPIRDIICAQPDPIQSNMLISMAIICLNNCS